jgi:hypothetical protein
VVFKRFRDVIAGGVSSYDVVVRSFADGSERESEYASSLASIQGGRMSWLADGRLFVGVASGRAQFSIRRLVCSRLQPRKPMRRARPVRSTAKAYRVTV